MVYSDLLSSRYGSLLQGIKGLTLYHGASTERAAKGIKRSGIQPQAPKSYGHMTPLSGAIYLTKELRYAVIYALGGDYIGHKSRDVGFGYLFVVSGGDLTNKVRPDEDETGRLISEGTLDWLNDLAEDELGYETFTESYEDEDGEVFEMSVPLLRAVNDGEYAAWAVAGKLLDPILEDWQVLSILEATSHMSHKGGVKPRETWRFDKSLSGSLKRDASNFFDIAERVS